MLESLMCLTETGYRATSESNDLCAIDGSRYLTVFIAVLTGWNTDRTRRRISILRTVAELRRARFVMSVETVRNKVVGESTPAAWTGSLLSECKMILHTTQVLSVRNAREKGYVEGKNTLAIAIDVEVEVEVEVVKAAVQAESDQERISTRVQRRDLRPHLARVPPEALCMIRPGIDDRVEQIWTNAWSRRARCCAVA